MISIDTLLTPVTEDQVVANITTTLLSLGIPANTWRQAGALSTLRRAIARTVAGFSVLLAAAIGFGFLSKATGAWLRLLAFYVYGVKVPDATFASGTLTLVNGGGGLFSYAPGQAFFINSTSKKTYTNVDGFTLNPLGTVTINIAATEQGSGSSAAPGQIDALQSVMQLVTCSNPSPVIGLDQPSDDAVRQTCLDKLAARSVRGPRGAYRYYATHDENDDPVTNASGAPVNINRIRVSPASHTGTVTVTLAAPRGVPLDEDVAAADASIQENAVPDGVTETTVAATEVDYTAALIVWAKAAPGLAADDVQVAVESALDDYFATYDIGGLAKGTTTGLFASGIDGVVKSANDLIFAVDGAVDLAMSAGQVAVNQTTVTVRLVKGASA